MRIIYSDINREKGRLDRYFMKCIGAGRAAEVMRHAAYEQLKKIQNECPFEYIRFHGIFHDEMAVVWRDDEGKLNFNFQYVDLLFDSLLELNIRPLVELGLMPEDMASKDTHVFWWKMNTSPAKDINEWYLLIETFVRHLTDRYGEEEIKKWYFEVWNEPNLASFFSESKDIEQYFLLYDNAARAVKSVCPEYRVGGPATAGLRWIDKQIEHCNEKNVPLDFITSHAYCVHGYLDEDGKSQLKMLPHDYLTDKICEAGELCHSKNLPFLLTEWSSSYSSRDAVHDHYFNAPFILHAIKRCEGAAEMMSYWVYTDIFEEVKPPLKMFHGGFGLLTVQSVPKPSYHAFRFLSQLGERELYCEDKESYVCRNGECVQVLLWNSVLPDMENEYNGERFIRDIVPSKLENVQIELDGFEAGREYKIDVESVGHRMGDCYGEYLAMGAPDSLTREQTAELIQRSQPKKQSLSVCADSKGKLKITLEQNEDRVDFVTVHLV